MVEPVHSFEAERARLARLAAGVLGDPVEAEDVVQQTWLRFSRALPESEIDSVPAWLTTVATRLCLDRLKARIPVPVAEPPTPPVTEGPADPSHELALAETVGFALQVVLDRLSPRERVAFVLHDSFGFEFATVGAVLQCSPPAARKLASRARVKVAGSGPSGDGVGQRPDWVVVDAFMAAARNADFGPLMELLAPDAVVAADEFANAAGTPERIQGAHEIAAFFNGGARAAIPVWSRGRPGAAWFHRGAARVLFDFEIEGRRVSRITFRADPAVLAGVERRRDGSRPEWRERPRSPSRSHRAGRGRRTSRRRRTHQERGRTHEDHDLSPAGRAM
ncbi:MAG: sigma factor [Ornithinimicrobium sp.]